MPKKTGVDKKWNARLTFSPSLTPYLPESLIGERDEQEEARLISEPCVRYSHPYLRCRQLGGRESWKTQ